MVKSIRTRLQLWYAAVLLAVVGGFAGLLYLREREARLQEVDARVRSAALYLDANLRPFPPFELHGSPADEPPPPPRRPPPPGRERLVAGLDVPPEAKGSSFAVWRADGSVLKASVPPGEPIPDEPAPGSVPAQVRLSRRGEVAEAAMLGPGRTRIVVWASLGPELAALDRFAWQLAAAGAAVLAVGLAGGWLVSARILRPVAAISDTASAISATNLSQRIDVAGVDLELADLARVLNEAFDRLEAAFERQTRFTADASHELRTPLAILRTHAELALARPRPAEEYRETIETCLRAAVRMSTLVEGLLTLARADAGKLELLRQPVDLRQVVEEGLVLFRPLAEGRDVRLSSALEPAEVVGDGVRLAQVLTNLLSNALQYNRTGGEVRVGLTTEPAEAVLAVTDTGCGIPEEDRPYLFERFYRVDKARARASGGNGLGLAICKSIVEAHGGTIGFTTEAGRGSTFTVRLPRHGEFDFPAAANPA
ncbi:MAG TPA: ATP-binding protein [Gemmataceae bacterium]|nr:ATP-binding protein [Gemmataceae bacterium]